MADIHHLNALITRANARWVAGPTSVSDLPPEQQRRRLGYVPADGEESLEQRAQASAAKVASHRISISTTPSSFDWRNVNGQNYVTAITDQGNCGSCVAFGTTATVEANFRIQRHKDDLVIDLSEASLFFCVGPSTGASCGRGWNMTPALNGYKDIGVPDEACFPYTGHDQACSQCTDWQGRVTQIAGWHALNSVADMKDWLSVQGPLATCFTVYQDFYAYRSGVYQHVSGDQVGGHCVCVVGYNDAEGYWICKNSWGSGWGEAGFFRIAYGECGIDSMMWVVEGIVGYPFDDPRVFDADFYLNHDPDLLAVYGNDRAAARNHWLNQGLPNEGRRGSREFDLQFYLIYHDDLRNLFGTDFKAALANWLLKGLPNEARRGSREVDVQFYLAHHPDLQNAFGTNYGAALDHWINQGFPIEGRRGSRELDVQFYLTHHPDLQSAFGTNYKAAFDHWVNQGLLNEGRRGSREFDVQFYLADNDDLRSAFGTNYTAALDHWLKQGLKNEGRRGSREFDVRYYLAHNDDLRSAFGTNYTAALDHWLNQGLPSEGRRGSQDFDVTFYRATYLGGVGSFQAAFDDWVNTGISLGRKGAP